MSGCCLPNGWSIYRTWYATPLAAAAYLQVGRVADARAAVERALTSRETWERHLLLARVHIADGRTAEARTQLLRVLEIDPGNRTATGLLAQIGG